MTDYQQKGNPPTPSQSKRDITKVMTRVCLLESVFVHDQSVRKYEF